MVVFRGAKQISQESQRSRGFFPEEPDSQVTDVQASILVEPADNSSSSSTLLTSQRVKSLELDELHSLQLLTHISLVVFIVFCVVLSTLMVLLCCQQCWMCWTARKGKKRTHGDCKRTYVQKTPIYRERPNQSFGDSSFASGDEFNIATAPPPALFKKCSVKSVKSRPEKVTAPPMEEYPAPPVEQDMNQMSSPPEIRFHSPDLAYSATERDRLDLSLNRSVRSLSIHQEFPPPPTESQQSHFPEQQSVVLGYHEASEESSFEDEDSEHSRY